MMKNKFLFPSTAALAVLLCSCAATSLKKTWKSPEFNGGPVKKVAVLVIVDRDMVRKPFEGRFVRQLEQQGAVAFSTIEMLSLPKIKEDKEGTAARLRQEGADSILIVRLVDKTTYSREVRTMPAAYLPVATGFSSYGWYDYCSIAFVDMGVTYDSTKDRVILDTSLFDLNTGKRLWFALTETVLKFDTDRYEEADIVAAKVVEGLRKDGLVR